MCSICVAEMHDVRGSGGELCCRGVLGSRLSLGRSGLGFAHLHPAAACPSEVCTVAATSASVFVTTCPGLKCRFPIYKLPTYVYLISQNIASCLDEVQLNMLLHFW